MSESSHTRTPSYRLHKPTGQAIVTLCGRMCYLGPHGSQVSKRRYDQLIAEWLANGRRLPKEDPAESLTLGELSLRYWDHAGGYYVKDGQPTSELGCIRLALRDLNDLYADTPVGRFGPLALKAVRQKMIDRGLSRGTINGYISRIKGMFRWGVENEWVPSGIHEALKAVAGLRRGRSGARETEPVRPVPDTHVDAVGAHVPPQVWAMVQLQRITGMRSTEVALMRACDLDMTGTLWQYTPPRHKTSHHGFARQIWLGPKAQEILRPFLRTDLEAYLFSPAEAQALHFAERRSSRRSPRWPSHDPDLRRQRRATGSPKRRAGTHYTKDSYRRVIVRACRRAGVPQWTPHQLRHNAATRIRKDYGVEAARALLGHHSVAVTELYAEMDDATVRKIAAQVG